MKKKTIKLDCLEEVTIRNALTQVLREKRKSWLECDPEMDTIKTYYRDCYIDLKKALWGLTRG